MKVLFGDTTNAGTSYYRMRTFVEPLLDMGHDVAMLDWDPNRRFAAPWETTFIEPRVWAHFGVLFGSCDVAVFQALHCEDSLRAVIAAREHFGKPVLMEADDYLFGVQSDQPAYADWYPGSDYEALAMAQLQASDGVIVSTDFLAKAYGAVNPKLSVVPNGVDPDLWPNPDAARVNGMVRIGWQGGASHTRDLETIKDAVLSLADEFKGRVEWLFIGGVPDFLKHHPAIKYDINFVPVLEYPARMRALGLDIGLAPLCDSAFARSKSDLRYLEYSALGVPTVATKGPAYSTIQDSVTGCLATNPAEWASALRFLIQNEAKRREMGAAARHWVIKNRTNRHSAELYADALEAMTNGADQAGNS